MPRQHTLVDIFLLSIVALLPICAFVIRNGSSTIPIITELNLSPEFFLSNLSYCWQPYYEAGFDNSQSSWYIFPVGPLFAAFSTLGVGSAVVSLLFHFGLYLLSGISTYYLLSVIEQIDGHLPRSGKLVVAVFYMLNPFTLLYIHELGSQQLLASAVLPLMLGLFILGFRKKKLSHCLIIGLVSVLAAANITFFVTDLLVLMAYALYDAISSRGRNFVWKSGFLIAMLAAVLVSNAYWLLPRMSNFAAEYSAAFRGAESISGSLALNSQSSSYIETFRLMGSWSFQPLYFSFYHIYYSPAIMMATITTPLLALSTLTRRPMKRFEIFFGLIAILCVPLAVAAYPLENPSPTGRLYIWFYENVPFFVIFRGAYKFVMVITLSYAVLLGFAIARISRWKIFKHWNQRIFKLVVLGLAFFLLLGSWPSFNGQMVEANKNFVVPRYYFDAANWLSRQSGNFRLMTIPEMRHVQYIWDNETKFSGTDVSIPIFKVPIVGQSYYLPLGSADTDRVTHELYRMILANETLNLAEALKLLNVRYVMIHGDYQWTLVEWNKAPQHLFDTLSKTPNIVSVKSFGELHFFENLMWSDSTILLAKSSGNSSPNIFSSVSSVFLPQIDRNASKWTVVNNTLVSNGLYEYNDDVVLSRKGYTNLNLTFEAKSSNGYFHIYFFATDKQNAHRLWLNNTFYELSEVKDGKYAIEKAQEHGLLLNLSDWSSYEMKISEDVIQITVNRKQFEIPNDRTSVAGRVGFASTINIVSIKAIELQYLEIEVDLAGYNALPYLKVNPTRYEVFLHNMRNSSFLILTDSFSQGWNAYRQDGMSVRIQHVKALDYANGWYIDQIDESPMILEYGPQGFYETAVRASLSIYVLLFLFTLFSVEESRKMLGMIYRRFKAEQV